MQKVEDGDRGVCMLVNFRNRKRSLFSEILSERREPAARGDGCYIIKAGLLSHNRRVFSGVARV